MKKNFIIKLDNYDIRLDRWLKINFSSLNQSFIEKNIRKGNIKVNNKKVISKYKLQIKDKITIFNYSDNAYFHQKEKIFIKKISNKYKELFQSNIVFQNESFLILNKWTGIATQGGSKINISIDDIIKNISKNYNLVHRLDRETSGLLIIAKDLNTTKFFGKMFRDQLIKKTYIAICQGNPRNNESEILLEIDNKKDPSKKFQSVTSYKVYQTNNNLSNILFFPKTGKTHQIRIVAKHLGCPIIGDTKYNIHNRYSFEKLKLNAYKLKFNFMNKEYEFFSTLPDHFTKFFKKNKLKLFNALDTKFFF